MLTSNKQEPSVNVTRESDFVPARMLEVEIGQPLQAISAFDEKTGQCYRRAMCLVRLHTQALGLVELELNENEVDAQEYSQHIWHALGTKINEHLRQDGLPPVTGLDVAGLSSLDAPRCIEERERFLADAPFVSVIVPTHDRPEKIQVCLSSLISLHYPHYEIIIVDNAPSTNATADFIQQSYGDVSQVRYIREDHPGYPWACNSGVMAARAEVLAFTDDDAVVDTYWLAELIRGFNLADDVACVTGLILPWELETPAQAWFQQYGRGGSSKAFTRCIFDMSENHPKTPLFPYHAGSMGGGANMAFKAQCLYVVGGLATLLEAAMDIEAFFRLIIHGYKLVYEPAAIVHHFHRRDYADLRNQMYRYGMWFTAYLTKSLLDNPRLFFDLLAKLPYGLFSFLRVRFSKNKKKGPDYPRDLTISELKGMLRGPSTYISRWWAMRSMHMVKK